MKRKSTDYKIIHFWHSRSGSYPYYTRQVQQQAVEDNAPLNATFKGKNGWHTLDDVLNTDIIEAAIREGLIEPKQELNLNEHTSNK